MEKSNRYPKSWYDIQADFEEMQKMSCVPQNIRKVPHNFIFDEDQSVKWNKEQVVANNNAYSEEVARLNTLKNKRRDSIYEDIYFTIQCEVGHNLSREKAIKIWNYAWEQGHAYGIREVCCHLENLITHADELLSK